MARLILSVRDNDVVVIEEGKLLVRVDIRGTRVRLIFDAPPEVPIDRLAVWERKRSHERPAHERRQA